MKGKPDRRRHRNQARDPIRRGGHGSDGNESRSGSLAAGGFELLTIAVHRSGSYGAPSAADRRMGTGPMRTAERRPTRWTQPIALARARLRVKPRRPFFVLLNRRTRLSSFFVISRFDEIGNGFFETNPSAPKSSIVVPHFSFSDGRSDRRWTTF